ncbi:MAG TPA: hypothetical protein VFY49_06965 [Myxococcota bacterium]|nr:hypothetical protein [Myxococcota bacterium]
MEQDEFENPDVCSACGAAVYDDAEGVFGYGTENVLCASCAQARGGRYDVERDTWDVQPDLSGLRDESYGAAPHEQRRRRE